MGQPKIKSRTSQKSDKDDRLNTLRPKQNGRHFADDTFKDIFCNENVWIFNKIALKYVY